MDPINRCNDMLINTLKKFTKLSHEAITEIIPTIPIEIYKKGTILLQQGNIPVLSYYLILGSVRQYVINEQGKEITVDFYTDEQAINMFSLFDDNLESLYSLSCLEDCYMVTCPEPSPDKSEDMDPEIEVMRQIFFKKQFIDLQKHLTKFKLLSPEERFIELVENRSELFKKVPQNILASYLDITPETFSRFKKKLL